MHKSIIAATLAILLSGCAMGPDYQAQEMELPEHWPEQLEQSSEQQQSWQQWWTRFEDPALTALVERALDDNLELQLQLQRIEQARAQLGLSNANRWPSLSAQADATREQQPAGIFPPELGGGAPRNQFAVSGVLSYELDLWGRVARQRESAIAQLEGSLYGTEAVRLNLVTEVVTTYFNLRAAEQQYATGLDTLESRRETLQLEEYRDASGASDPLSIRQARAELAGTQALLPELRQQVHTLQSALAMLVGYSAEELLLEMDFGDSRLADIQLPDDVPAVMPSELLQRRPDVRAAESSMIAANAQVGVAMAERWPSLNLNAMIGTAALDTSDLFTSSSETWSLGAGLAGPIFDFGRRRANVESAEAQSAQAQIEYQMAVTSAFRDVRDALTLYQNSEQRVAAIRRQTDAIRETVEMAEIQYELGAIGFYELLNARRELMNAEMNLSDAVSDRLIASASLFKAMGGGWNEPDADEYVSEG
ncbi:RND transporter [Aliidiomarina minuta]|uniref:RND transporter n=1 Tax=Aliidiomarina minuta TaxID=880057 RepID=A0A432W6R6_9GAMM|nr:efflux transporter outer membrane subunit [Aliidiomarina minuta]RUO25773.1 RND transporter [Aliidiomarina minuta]